MASGRVELASVGVQDEFITGQPDITFFLKNFRRHAKFALDTIDNNFDGEYTELNADNKPVASGAYADNKKIGTWLEYNEKGKKKKVKY